MHTILIILLIGAFLGFVFSRKGNELEGAVGGAKKAGCLIVGLVLAIIIVAVIAFVSL